LVTAAALGLLAHSGVASAAPPPAQFRWLVPARAPSGWKHLALPSGEAILSYPPSLAPIKGDSSSVSVAQKNADGRIALYLNATPKQGTEQIGTWPAFRLQHDRGETDRVHVIAKAVGLSFLGGKGSCLVDDYYTRVKVHHYQEIACFVQGRSRAAVIIAAALQSDWKRAAPLLERAVSAYQVK
jgi:hypothetical protein